MTAIKGFRHVQGGRSWTVRNRSSPRTWLCGLVHLCIIGRKRIHLEKYISGESGKLCQISGAGPILIMSQFFSICWRCLSVLCCAMQSQLFGQIRGVGPPDRATWAQQMLFIMRNRGVQVCLYWRYFPSPHFRIRIRIIIIILEADIHRKGNHVPMVTNYLIHTLGWDMRWEGTTRIFN